MKQLRRGNAVPWHPRDEHGLQGGEGLPVHADRVAVPNAELDGEDNMVSRLEEYRALDDILDVVR